MKVLVEYWYDHEDPEERHMLLLKIAEQVLTWVLTITTTLHMHGQHCQEQYNPMCKSSTLTLKLQFDDHEVSETTLAHELTW